MKVYELLSKGIAYVDRNQTDTMFGTLIDQSLEVIKDKIVRTDSIDEIIELKKLHKQLQTLKYRSFSIGQSLDSEVDEFLKDYLN